MLCARPHPGVAKPSQISVLSPPHSPCHPRALRAAPGGPPCWQRHRSRAAPWLQSGGPGAGGDMPAGQPGSKPAAGCASHDAKRPGQLLHHQLNGQRGTRDEWRIIYLTFLLCHPSHPLRFPRARRELAGAQPLPCMVGSKAAVRLRFLPGVQQGRNEVPLPPELLLCTPHPWCSPIPGAAPSPPCQQHPHHPAMFLLSSGVTPQHPATCENLLQKCPYLTSTGEKKSDLKRHKPQKAPSALPKCCFCACHVIFTLIS